MLTVGIFFALLVLSPKDSDVGSPSSGDLAVSIMFGVLMGAGLGLLWRFVSTRSEQKGRKLTPSVQLLMFAGLYVVLGGMVMAFTARPRWFVITDVAASSFGYLLFCTLFLTPLRERMLDPNTDHSKFQVSDF